MTIYIVLQKQDGGWAEISRGDARSADSALRNGTLALPNAEGTFVAVPARSWRPRTVKAESKTVLTIT